MLSNPYSQQKLNRVYSMKRYNLLILIFFFSHSLIIHNQTEKNLIIKVSPHCQTVHNVPSMTLSKQTFDYVETFAPQVCLIARVDQDNSDILIQTAPNTPDTIIKLYETDRLHAVILPTLPSRHLPAS